MVPCSEGLAGVPRDGRMNCVTRGKKSTGSKLVFRVVEK